ncbi:hypothetical protein I350_03552 [Cryptococcus amylolentus CBS 6273]|uniref:NEDD8 carrier protein n=1 Tax=Cryptococcus amylolentus CBS 6273 TaxID=1296118 RepID=A0A1E3K4F7_9TREE|nr:hypothetical protein I350_03552 [Cryptococcus amylolentus CBS 6273]
MDDASDLWSVKKNEEAAAKKRPKVTAAQLRVQKDLTELDLPSTMKTVFPDPTDVLNFTLTITPDEGIYKGGVFNFSFAIKPEYPHEPPKVRCKEKIYHPNLDLEGNVCLNILREDWKPVLTLSSVMIDAAEDFRRSRETFVHNVKQAMRGGYVGSEKFDKVLA